MSPYVAALEEAGLLPPGFGQRVLARVHELRAEKEKTLGWSCLPDPPRLLSLDGRPSPAPAPPPVSEEHRELARAMHQIIDADIAFLQTQGLWHGIDHIGLAATRRLKRALEDPGADRLFLDFCLVHFENTMIGYENDVGGLEDLHLLPKGFGKTTLERVHRLRGKPL